jgi:hypothetical protein
MIIRIFQVLSIVFALAAGFFLWQANADGAFVSAVLAAVCFFLIIRFQIKERIAIREAERHAAESTEL